ncbi:saccharopine dehydrogenase NADP-binding domain-containing protein [Microbulbifer sp. 2304DJ12-6]|uniref:saccharopine dehydrogenase NADP-binding domain-containing protein n=1 Tax=Microbulbifer sp. 2304DJ12-6 TaxID=3233340 RepID=UPI0039AEEAA6
MTIAILGGYGDVGAAVTGYLQSLEMGLLRIGGRNAHKQPLSSNSVISYQTVDYLDAASLDQFVSGCKVLINCAGPSHLIDDRVAKAAAQVGAAYIDVAGDETLYEQLDSSYYQNSGLIAVLSAGLQPGLSSLLPRWLAEQEFSQVERLTSYFGLRDRFTDVAADDYLQGANDQHSKPLAAWRNGRRVNGVLKRRSDVELPFFPDTATVLPYLNSESERLARDLSLSEGDWYNAITGSYILSAFNTAHGLSRDEARAALCRASELDLAGRHPYVVMLLQLTGKYNGQERTRTAVLRGTGNADLTAAVAAVTTLAVLREEIPAGCHYCAQVLPPASAMERMSEIEAFSFLTTLETSIEDMECLEEGAI